MSTGGGSAQPAAPSNIVGNFKAYFLSIIAICILFLHDRWIELCDLTHEIWCKYLCIMALRDPPRTLLYAYLDPSKLRGPSPDANVSDDDAKSTDTNIRYIPADVTSIVLAYYRADTINSCFTLQEWLKRFDISARYINLIFIRNSDMYHARLDLDNDIETNTESGADTNISYMPGKILHSLDSSPKSHVE